jgi:hypothetical protein
LAALLALGIVSLALSKADFWAEFGRAMLSLAAAVAITGVLSVALTAYTRSRDEAEARRLVWREIMRAVVNASERLDTSRILIRAERSAQTYRNEMHKLIEAWASLHWIDKEREVREERALRWAIWQMRHFLKGLALEYEREAASLMGSDSATIALGDHRTLPRLQEMLDPRTFRTSSFNRGYEQAKSIIRVHLQ